MQRVFILNIVLSKGMNPLEERESFEAEEIICVQKGTILIMHKTANDNQVCV